MVDATIGSGRFGLRATRTHLHFHKSVLHSSGEAVGAITVDSFHRLRGGQHISVICCGKVVGTLTVVDGSMDTIQELTVYMSSAGVVRSEEVPRLEPVLENVEGASSFLAGFTRDPRLVNRAASSPSRRKGRHR